MNLGEKIEQLLKTTAMTKVELSKKLGLKDSSVVSHWVKNRFKPDRDNVVKLSAVFEKPVSYFTDDNYSYSRRNDDDNLEQKIHDLIAAWPQTAHLGVIAEISEENFSIPYYNQPEELLPVMLDSKNSAPFALKIASQEACPWAQKGEYLIIVPSSGESAGKLVVAKAGGFYTIKKISKAKSKTHLVLEDINKKQYKYKPQEAEVIGKVLAFYRKP